MNIVFISNYLTHHQRPLCDELAMLSDFHFVSTQAIPQERLDQGWTAETASYTLPLAQAERAVAQADMIILGNGPAKLIRKYHGLVFRYTERPLKHGPEPMKYLPRLLKWHIETLGRKQYLLCAGGYVAADYAKFGLYQSRAYRFGYFPAVPPAPTEKEPDRLLWCGRFLPWKHPEHAVFAVKQILDAGYHVRLDMIGSGKMEDTLRSLITQQGLTDRVRLLGAMDPAAVQAHMARSGVFLCTSGRQEGWGAVINEAMGNGCAVIASHAAGAAPYLITHGRNGLIYPSGDVDALTSAIKKALDDPDRQQKLGTAARSTIESTWNAQVAANRLVKLAEHILSENVSPDLFQDGPCSRAEIIKE